MAWGNFVKWVAREFGETAAFQLYSAFFDEDEDIDPRTLPIRRAELHFTRTSPTGTTEDRAITHFDFISLNDLFEGGSFDSAALNALDTAIATWWTSVKPGVTGNHTLLECRWRTMQFATPVTEDERFLDSGAPVRVTSINSAGTNAVSSYLPYQVAMAVTLKTPVRRHWGRIYIPGLAGEKIGSTGRVTSAWVDTVATATRTLYGSANTNNTPMCVLSTRQLNAYAAMVFGISEIQADDVPDIIRRRRGKQTAYRKTITT